MSTHLFYLLSAPQHFIVYTQKIFSFGGQGVNIERHIKDVTIGPGGSLNFFLVGNLLRNPLLLKKCSFKLDAFEINGRETPIKLLYIDV